MPLGNDVVDLRHPLCQPDAIHPRFDARAFSRCEIALLEGPPERAHALRWTLWAAKESACKAARQLDPGVRFLPRDFEVTLSGERARVDHRSGRFEVRLERTDDWLHALASQGRAKPRFRVEGDPSANPERELEEAGTWVRRLARLALGELLGVPSDELRIASVDRVPRLELRGEALPVELSLSHDGRFIACAWNMVEP